MWPYFIFELWQKICLRLHAWLYWKIPPQVSKSDTWDTLTCSSWLDCPSLWINSTIYPYRSGPNEPRTSLYTTSLINCGHPYILLPSTWSHHTPWPKQDLHVTIKTYQPHYHQLKPPARLCSNLPFHRHPIPCDWHDTPWLHRCCLPSPSQSP